MIRPALYSDIPALMRLLGALDLFGPEELAGLNTSLTTYFADSSKNAQQWIIDEDNGTAAGLALLAPEQMTDGTWNLQLIAVDPLRQRTARGKNILRFVEQSLRDTGQRLLIIDTSSAPEFENTQSFYLSAGYEQEARIREFWKRGEDKITFRKLL